MNRMSSLRAAASALRAATAAGCSPSGQARRVSVSASLAPSLAPLSRTASVAALPPHLCAASARAAWLVSRPQRRGVAARSSPGQVSAPLMQQMTAKVRACAIVLTLYFQRGVQCVK